MPARAAGRSYDVQVYKASIRLTFNPVWALLASPFASYEIYMKQVAGI
jgi:hypothetical protein